MSRRMKPNPMIEVRKAWKDAKQKFIERWVGDV
jgi:hypothetical protein